MFSIGNDEKMMEIETRYDNALAQACSERDHCRNALIILCKGNREAVYNAISDALDGHTKKDGWMY